MPADISRRTNSFLRITKNLLGQFLRSPVVLFLATFFLLAIPAIYTIDRAWLSLHERKPIAIAVCLVAIVIAQIAASLQFKRVLNLITPIETRSTEDRDLAFGYLMRGLLSYDWPDTEDFELRVYRLDREGLLYCAWSPPGVNPEKRWKRGSGAVGTAYDREEAVSVSGNQCWDDSHGIDPTEADRYRNLKCVIAIPCKSARKAPVAILTASSETKPNPESGTIASLREAAIGVARCVIDVQRSEED